MTTSQRAFPANLREKLDRRKQTEQGPQKPSDTGDIAKRLMTYMVDADRRRFFIALVVRLVGDISLILVPVLTGLALNTLSPNNASSTKTEDLLILVGLAIVAGVVYLVTGWYAERQFADLATRGLSRLQTALFDHMQTLSLSFFDRQPLGQLMSRITNDTSTLQQVLSFALIQVLSGALLLVWTVY
ncbi:MAG: ABC transporter transmembrane domain-containing protein, partial [Candidatus Eisenbacteria bacterium]|nr:ABC transporter transmembrane domain-containing protein [Candidatus Eisenbacteria bacterium]